ncbi:nucleotide exchange factor GrpE [Sphaerisporangium album]|uniref:Protein GrpE n=1 Tax=Sphaerisporangium album TaxID=509200 RepID=A0A367FPJ7_9ACTN|nr:nucleotide exchange factor GrpE [Sphaerisporangium album]RCG31610.1 nucleotide exchange factor GrpE [Sphaerisporangium album]
MADQHDEAPRGTRAGPAGPATPPEPPELTRSAETSETGPPETAENFVGSPVEDMEARIAELEDRWLRSAAELDNFRKRIARDAERIRTDERDRVIRDWLPIIDNLDLALRHAGAVSTAENAVIEGVRAVRDQAVGLLARLGFRRHDEVGVPFDPAFHEAMGTVQNEELPAGTVMETVRPGYGEGERQLRPASVIVSTAPD